MTTVCKLNGGGRSGALFCSPRNAGNRVLLCLLFIRFQVKKTGFCETKIHFGT